MGDGSVDPIEAFAIREVASLKESIKRLLAKLEAIKDPVHEVRGTNIFAAKIKLDELHQLIEERN